MKMEFSIFVKIVENKKNKMKNKFKIGDEFMLPPGVPLITNGISYSDARIHGINEYRRILLTKENKKSFRIEFVPDRVIASTVCIRKDILKSYDLFFVKDL